MTVRHLRAYLTNEAPPFIESAYHLAKRFNVGQDTARDILGEFNYTTTPDTGWTRSPTQLDRIERKLGELYALLLSLAAEPLDITHHDRERLQHSFNTGEA